MASMTFRRFCGSVAVGFVTAPLLSGAAVVFCDSVNGSGSSSSSFDSFFGGFRRGSKSEYERTWGVPWVEDWDRPTVRGIRGDRSSSYRRQIILIRHGQYENEKSDDDKIRRLTKVGEKQARATGVYLKSLFDASGRQLQAADTYRVARQAYQKALKDPDTPTRTLDALDERMQDAHLSYLGTGGLLAVSTPRQVYVSDMTRAKQTVNLILEAFPAATRKTLTVDPQLRERFPCDVEPRRTHTASPENMRAAEEVFERYFHRPTSDQSSVEIIVGHANVIRYLTMRVLQLPPEAWLRSSLPHCSVTTITIRGNGHVSAVGIGSYGHLSPELVTTSNVP